LALKVILLVKYCNIDQERIFDKFLTGKNERQNSNKGRIYIYIFTNIYVFCLLVIKIVITVMEILGLLGSPRKLMDVFETQLFGHILSFSDQPTETAYWWNFSKYFT